MRNSSGLSEKRNGPRRNLAIAHGKSASLSVLKPVAFVSWGRGRRGGGHNAPCRVMGQEIVTMLTMVAAMSAGTMRSKRRFLGLVLLALVSGSQAWGGDPPQKSETENLPPPAQLTTQEDHQRMLDSSADQEAPARGESARPESPQRGQLRRSQRHPVPQPARPAGAKQWAAGHHGPSLVEAAAPGNRGRFRPGNLWPGPAAHAAREMGGDRQGRADRRRRARHHEAACRARG